jgi:hypothetical protein
MHDHGIQLIVNCIVRIILLFHLCGGTCAFVIHDRIKVHSHVCFKVTYKLLIEQLASIPLVENDFLATFKLLCSIHGNVS